MPDEVENAPDGQETVGGVPAVLDENIPAAYPDDDPYEYRCGRGGRLLATGNYTATTSASANWTVIPTTYNAYELTTGQFYTISANVSTYNATPVYSQADLDRLHPARARWDDGMSAMRANIERHDRNHEAQIARAQERQQAMELARTRATSLLEKFLSPDQLEDYRLNKRFDVIGSLGNRFTIRQGTSGNITVHRPDGSRSQICAHPSGGLPSPDVHLAQMLAIMTDERAFVQMANCHAGTPIRYDDEGNIRPEFGAIRVSQANNIIVQAA